MTVSDSVGFFFDQTEKETTFSYGKDKNQDNYLGLKEPENLYGPKISESEEFDTSLLPEKKQEKKQEKKILRKITGVVHATSDTTVLVGLQNDAVKIEFPRELFKDESLIRLGQPLEYRICEESSGFRYQEFAVGQDLNKNHAREEIEAILADIKPRQK